MADPHHGLGRRTGVLLDPHALPSAEQDDFHRDWVLGLGSLDFGSQSRMGYRSNGVYSKDRKPKT